MIFFENKDDIKEAIIVEEIEAETTVKEVTPKPAAIEVPVNSVNDKRVIQFTAKANTATKDFCKHVEDIIKYRVETKLSIDRQHCIMQMFNFAVNYSEGWKFTTGKQDKVYLK